MEDLTGLRLCVRYAFVCAADKLRKGKISQGEYNHLSSFALGETDVLDPEMVRRVFPALNEALGKFAHELGTPMFALETVKQHWRHHHGHKGDCRVTFGEVIEVASANIVKVRTEEKDLGVLNFYQLSLRVGSKVTLHRRTVIEEIS